MKDMPLTWYCRKPTDIKLKSHLRQTAFGKHPHVSGNYSTSKATELTDIKCFDSNKNLKRFDYIKRSLFIVAGVILAHFLYTFRFSHRDVSSSLVWIVDILIGGSLLIWTLTSRIIKQIRINYKDQR